MFTFDFILKPLTHFFKSLILTSRIRRNKGL
nr:MAG TPA: hypothetical protein [Caudoviricetes sp.]DAP21205.1 MAG TPA: hypothetical protein [Caudoviricetes sp.]